MNVGKGKKEKAFESAKVEKGMGIISNVFWLLTVQYIMSEGGSACRGC